MSHHVCLFLTLIPTLALPVLLDAGDTKDAPKTIMLRPGKLLVTEDFKQPLGKEWFGKPGKWDIVDGTLRGVEKADDMHAAVRRREITFKSAVVQFSFKFDGATMASLSMNGDSGHVCRVRFDPASFTVIRDKDKVNGGKPNQMETKKAEFKKGEWHTMIVEMADKEIVATVDGKLTAFGTDAGLAATKTSVGFTMKGDSISFKNLRVYEGTALPTWGKTREKLVAERKK
jgi:hypothetical protein